MTVEQSSALTAISTVILAIATILLFGVTAMLAWAAKKQLPILGRQLATISEQLRVAKAAEIAAAERHEELSRETARRHEDQKLLDERRKIETETLRICGIYDTDPIIHAACRRIWDASNKGKTYTGDNEIDEHDVITVANYLDGIAIGVLQGVYESKMTKDHLGDVIRKVSREVITTCVNDYEIHYPSLIRLADIWYPGKAPDISYTSESKIIY